MPFPATSETCYVAPPTLAPTFPPPPSLSLAAFSRPFTLLLECFFPFAECFSQTQKPPSTLSPVPGPDAHSYPGFFPLFALPINLSPPLADLLPFDISSKYCLCPRLLLALLLEHRYWFRRGRQACLEARAVGMPRAELAPGVEGGRQWAGFSPRAGKLAGRSIVISVDVTHSRAA